MSRRRPMVVLKDSTLREGLDTPAVFFSLPARLRIAAALAAAGVPEVEIVAPSRVRDDLRIAEKLKAKHCGLRTSGLVYANRPECPGEVESAARLLDHVDLLMPLSPQRPPHNDGEKISVLLTMLEPWTGRDVEVGAGFPHSTQVPPERVLAIAKKAVAAGAKRITVYDTNGSADPFSVQQLISGLTAALAVPVFFHAHNDFGLATANAFAAVCAGAAGLDVTANGLGDRAGNASLEQIALLLQARGWSTGMDLGALKGLSRLVERLSGVPVSKLAPVVGEYVFAHKSPSHLYVPTEFEAFHPELIGTRRRIDRGASARPASRGARRGRATHATRER
jgi:homocitrate synthase NifV